ncbi:3-carboxymuconate cyclase protein [Rutstroemia sp. NJR-2017a WRK4]|nr:3-carboxymuconate cyclase protein [Rutstroemia sp. NJR-2017a WRK4]
MHFLTTTTTASLLLLLPLANAAPMACKQSVSAAYVLDNNPNGSAIIAMAIAADGSLSNPTRTATGGKGMLGLDAPAANASAGTPPMPGNADSLFSQHSVVVAGNYLFAVNAGSATLSMFSIPANNPLHPSLVGKPVATMGEFPVAVAYSEKLGQACVLNGGVVAGVSCFSADPKKGLQAVGGLRQIALNQTTPPVGPTGTASDIIFNPASNNLLVSLKGTPTTTGTFISYPVTSTPHNHSISTTAIISQPPQIHISFGMSFISASSLLVTDPSHGASLMSISSSTHQLTETHSIPVAGQGAICWSVFNPSLNEVYLMDVSHPNITAVDAQTGAIKRVLEQDASTLGSLDAELAGGRNGNAFLYVLKASGMVTVAETKRGVVKQTLDLNGLGSGKTLMGLAIWEE